MRNCEPDLSLVKNEKHIKRNKKDRNGESKGDGKNEKKKTKKEYTLLMKSSDSLIRVDFNFFALVEGETVTTYDCNRFQSPHFVAVAIASAGALFVLSLLFVV